MLEPIGVVVVQVRQDQGLEITAGVDTHGAQLRADLIAGFDIEVNREPEVQVPPREEPGP